jgi:predicted aspartyl protease
MKINAFASLTIHFAALILLLAAVCPRSSAQAPVHFQLAHDALIIIPVSANDEGPVYFLLDTGADTTIVDTALAKKLSLAAMQTIQQATVTGSQPVTVSVLARLAVGPAELPNLPVLEEDLSSLRRMDGRIVGIVGQDFLSHFNYLLSYRERTVRFEQENDLQDAMDGDPTPMQAAGHRMIVAAEAQAGADTRLRLVLDSGANSVVLMGPASIALHCAAAQQATETSSAGSAAMRTGRVDMLKVASRELRNLPVALVAAAPPQQTGDGLLPTMLFDSLYINNRQGFVIFNPRPRKL